MCLDPLRCPEPEFKGWDEGWWGNGNRRLRCWLRDPYNCGLLDPNRQLTDKDRERLRILGDIPNLAAHHKAAAKRAL